MHVDADEVRQRLRPFFEENFEKFGQLGAAVSVWQNGKPVALTSRCSQPLAGALTSFRVMKQLSILAKLVLASGG